MHMDYSTSIYRVHIRFDGILIFLSSRAARGGLYFYSITLHLQLLLCERL